MKQKHRFLFPLLMAIVMMAMSPQRMWADDVTISESTTISADVTYDDALNVTGGTVIINNGVTITISSGGMQLSGSGVKVINYGTICGDVTIQENNAVFANHGTVTGSVTATEGTFYNTGTYGSDSSTPSDCEHNFEGNLCSTCGYDVRTEQLTLSEGVTATFTDEGSYPWVVTEDPAYYPGLWSSNKGINGSSSTTTITLASTNDFKLSFKMYGSSEVRYDFCTVYIDNVEAFKLNKVANTSSYEYNQWLTQGVHTIKLNYSKDSSGNTGDDRCCIYEFKTKTGCTTHTWGDWTETVAATCTEKGSHYHTCSVCEITKTEDIPALGHDMQDVAAKAAGPCNDPGHAAYYHCTRCEKDFDNQEGTQPKTESLLINSHPGCEYHSGTNATCGAAGNTAYWSCSVCGKYFSDAECTTEIQKSDWVLAALQHTYEDNECIVCGAEKVQIGTGNKSDKKNVYNPYYKNSTTVTLYKGLEIGKSGKIARIAYNVTSKSDFATNEVKVYMMEADELLDDNNNPAFDWSKFTLVYSGNPTLGTATGWEWLTLDTPFEFDPANNLLIAVCRQSSGYTSNLLYAMDEDASSYRTIFYSHDNESSYGKLDDVKTKTIDDKTKDYTDIQLGFAPAPPVDTYELADGTKYDTQLRAKTLTYTRTFSNDTYNALYVPFAIPISALSDGEGGEPKASIYSLLNIFEEDKDDDGTIDEWVLKVVRMNDSESTEPNTPYIIKPAVSGDFSLTLSDIKLAKPKENSLWCASTDNMFTFTGVYSETGITQDQEFFISTTGGLQYAASDLTLAPQRWYMTINDKETGSIIAPSTFNTTANNARGIRIAVEGEDETTSINNAQLIINNGADTVYNLYGQKLTAPRKGVNIINGRKVMVK